MRDFELEVFFSKWEFAAKHHLTASDAESMTLSALLELASPEDRRAFDGQWLGYTESWGAPDLREAIAATYDSVGPSNVLCFVGAEEGIYAAMRVLLNPDDHAIVVVPNYQAAETIPLSICDVTGVPLLSEASWKLDLDALVDAIRPNTRLVSVNFPNNPTGAIPTHDEWKRLVEICRANDLYLFSDEVYRGLELHEGVRLKQSVDMGYDKCVSLNVMSKAYGLPGLRIGWIASHAAAFLQQCERYKHYLSICGPAPSERLAVIALRAREQILTRNREIVRANLELLDGFFGDHADLFEWRRPDGGCVSYPRYLGAEGVEQFCADALRQQGVLFLPSSIYRSELLESPSDRFRIGCGRLGLSAGLDALRALLA